MEMRQLTKNGVTVEYGIDGDEVVVRNPATGKELQRVPLKSEDEQMGTQGYNEFRTCMRGCYHLKQGDPWAFAGCIADCSTLIPTR
jgi:hypothetical protein